MKVEHGPRYAPPVTNLERFSDRAEDYARYRPSYPAALADHLADYGLRGGAQVMDVGSGTGLLSRLLLDEGAEVFAVEPNLAMRLEAERTLGRRQGFHSIDGTAEATTVESAAVDLIVAGQAFHWFDPDVTREEWIRVLRPGGWVALVWNELVDDGAFASGYRNIAKAFVANQEPPAQRRLVDPRAEIAAFFAPNPVERATFPNDQVLDLPGLKGRALSSSYWPNAGESFSRSMARLEELFEAHEVDGHVKFEYRTELFLGQLTKTSESEESATSNQHDSVR